MSRRAIIIPLIVLVVAALLFFGINTGWSSWFGGRADQETDDAYVRADMTPLSTRISGTVRKMDVEDFERVKAGQVLVEIDADEYHAIVEQAKAALAASQAALADNQAAKRIQAAKIQGAEAMVTQAEAAVSAARARVASTQPEVERTALQRKRQEALMASKATTPQELQSAVADAEHSSGALASPTSGSASMEIDTGSALSKLKLTKVCATGPGIQYHTKKSTEVRCESKTSRSS